MLFLSVEKLCRIPDSSPLARVLPRYNVSDIKSFCGVSIFDLSSRNLVTLPSVARARAAVLGYLQAPSQELFADDSQIMEFDITSNFKLKDCDDDLGESSSKEVAAILSDESVQLSFVNDLLEEADIKQRLPTNFESHMDMYGL